MNAKLFGTDGIRDRAGTGFLTTASVERLGWVIGDLLKQRRSLFSVDIPSAFGKLGRTGRVREAILVGRDTRVSGELLEAALTLGLARAGIEVLRVGVLPTPGVASLTRRWNCALGIVLSASHNPAADNGIKLFSPQGLKIPDLAEESIERLYFDSSIHPPDTKRRSRLGRNVSRKGGEYLAHLMEASGSPDLRGLKLVVDCANGATAPFAAELFRKAGAKIDVVYAKPNGLNINHHCGAVYPQEVAKEVRARPGTIGITFDGDGDRALFVDEDGRVRDGDFVLYMDVQGRRTNGEKVEGVVGTVMTNFALEGFLKQARIPLFRTKVGDRFVAEEMLRQRVRLGGEPSGHILFFDASPAGDGLLTALKTLSRVQESGQPLKTMCASLRLFPQVLRNIKVHHKPPLDSIPGVCRALQAAEKALGERGRVLLRYSGTESLCRVMVEGSERIKVQRVARELESVVRQEIGNA